MARYIDAAGGKIFTTKVQELGIKTELGFRTSEVCNCGWVFHIFFLEVSHVNQKQKLNMHHTFSFQIVSADNRVNKVIGTPEQSMQADMVILCTGVAPNGAIAKNSGIETSKNGGIVVDDYLRTSDPFVFAVGECVSHRSTSFGIVAPGYSMAKVLAANMTTYCGVKDGKAYMEDPEANESKSFLKGDPSTKLKLAGCDLASFGDFLDKLTPGGALPLVYSNPFDGVYKKLLFNKDGTRLVGGMLVGDASEYVKFTTLMNSADPLPVPPQELMMGKQGGEEDESALPDSAQVCSCNDVSKGQIREAVRNGNNTVALIKKCTKATAGCGGCGNLVKNIVNAEVCAMGGSVSKYLCPHFQYTRQELYLVIKALKLETFEQVLEMNGTGYGCEICKPMIGSLLSSINNGSVLKANRGGIQDSNDRYLANIQRDGTYSVVPRIAGGEITPEKLRVICDVAIKYKLYTKITGGQRVDLFGAPKQQLPAIWYVCHFVFFFFFLFLFLFVVFFFFFSIIF